MELKLKSSRVVDKGELEPIELQVSFEGEFHNEFGSSIVINEMFRNESFPYQSECYNNGVILNKDSIILLHAALTAYLGK